jgi:hypothetical protein
MPKPGGGGGGGGANLFSTNQTGPPPGPLTAGSSEFIDLGLIPTGKTIWFGSGQYASPDKSISFEIRTNTAGQSAGSEAATILLAATAVSPRAGLVTADYYRKGRLHITSVIGSGVEHFWLRLKAKSGSAAGYYFSTNYTTE